MFRDIQALIRACINKDSAAWEVFVGRFGELVRYSATQRLKRNGTMFSLQDIEDIVQSVFTELWARERLKEVRDRKKITAYLSIMAQNKAINYMTQKRERLLGKDEFYRIDNLADGPEASIDEGKLAALERALERLGPREKIMLKLNIIHGKTHREIARFMNMPVNTVSTIIARKKKALKEKIKL